MRETRTRDRLDRRRLTEHAVSRRDEPFTLASGATSSHYVDVKAALCHPEILRDVATAITDLAHAEGVAFTHVGGLTMGADAVAVAVALNGGAQWFSVRKEPKQRGHGRVIEGARLGPGDRVLLVDDVVSTGVSTLKALEAVTVAGATVAAAIPVVDRGVRLGSPRRHGVPRAIGSRDTCSARCRHRAPEDG